MLGLHLSCWRHNEVHRSWNKSCVKILHCVSIGGSHTARLVKQTVEAALNNIGYCLKPYWVEPHSHIWLIYWTYSTNTQGPALCDSKQIHHVMKIGINLAATVSHLSHLEQGFSASNKTKILQNKSKVWWKSI